ncbi:MAG: tetratricopeptide repeat protein [Cyanobacteria bacterium SZAS LIN-5]|nr:tetratricopeptide repeat protein [Cyanobacteria bacterium SZAS LIN-5]
MVSETVSQADTEFQQGNFDAAATLYAEAVAKCDNGDADPKNLASLVQKLADCQYAQNNFAAARESYARLVVLQEGDGFAARDRVSAYLKLARSADKCDAHDDASKNFQTAYELLSTLSATHFLRRSVIDAYADYLRAQGSNGELLVKLEDELGIKRDDAVAKDEIEEVSPDSIPTPITPKKPAGEEFVVLKSRLDRFRTKKTAEPESEEKAPTVLEKKTDKTVEQEVAERKFLRKGDSKNKSSKRSGQRSSLRSAMSKDHGGKPAGDGLTNAPDIPDVTDDAAAAAAQQTGSPARGEFDPRRTGEFDASPLPEPTPLPVTYSPFASGNSRPPEIDPSSLPQDMYPSAAASQLDADLPKSNDFYQGDLAKFVGRRPKRTLRSTGLVGDGQIAAPSLAVEAVSMPEATRSFLQQADAVKKATDVEQPAPDVDQLRVDGRVETIVPTSQKALSTLKLISPIIGLVLMLCAGFFIVQGLTPPKSSGNLPAFVIDLVGRKFVTADGALSLTIDRSKVGISGGVNRDARLKIWNGDWRDELALLQGAFSHSRWLVVKQGVLKDQNGATFYSLDAPERKTIFYCNAVAEAAQKYFNDNKKFPSLSTDLGELASYPNPYSGKASALVLLSTVDNKRVDSRPDSPLDVTYQSGELFKNEPAGAPGEVHAQSVSGQPIFSEAENTYTWQTQCFYVHAFDRDGKLIGGSGPGRFFLLTDKNGNMYPSTSQNFSKDFGDSDICLSETEMPKSDSITFKYLAALMAVFVLIVIVGVSSRMRYRR